MTRSGGRVSMKPAYPDSGYRLNSNSPRSWLAFGLIWLLGVDLRITLLAVPPVLPLIHRDLALNEKAVGSLTAMPVLLLGIWAIGGSLLISRIGARRAVIVGLIVISVTSAARGLGPTTAMLFGMTFLMGIGVAVCQPAAPTLIGEWFPRSIGLATAVYVNGLLVGETLSAAFTIPWALPVAGGSWERTFVFWAVPVAATAVLLVALTRENRPARAERAQWWPDWKAWRTWQIGLLLGGISVSYFGANAFMPDYLHATGRPQLIGIGLAALNAGQLPGSFLTLFIAQRIAGRKDLFIAIGIVVLAALAAMLSPFAWLFIGGSAFLGCAAALSLTMVVALPAMLTRQDDVARLSAGMFTTGYTVRFSGRSWAERLGMRRT